MGTFSEIPPVIIGDGWDPMSLTALGPSADASRYTEGLIKWAVDESTVKIQSLHPSFRTRVIIMFREAWKRGYLPYVYSGRRTFTHQKELYNKYTAGNGLIAARPGESKHNFGRAIDVMILTIKGGQMAEGLELLNQINLENNLRFEWGASYNDPNHFEDDTITITQLQKTDPDYLAWASLDTKQVEENKEAKELQQDLKLKAKAELSNRWGKEVGWIVAVSGSLAAFLIVLLVVKFRNA